MFQSRALPCDVIADPFAGSARPMAMMRPKRVPPARIPAGRWGDPSDLAGACVFLALPAGAYVHGHVLTVDGGWMAR
ncbi:hypothetical protein BJF92_08680 [Rhizobium rhizosphaerae]|uniref:SDR family oxidoreductase n=1 Tax=Xaviernesmea rhizosphaerae TaxID=1672749 RepID=A0A1Q9AKF4_9HYPH|nr:hypothetical protein BJF92_08680 [Xaviernesmea rhizosphaerae]